MIPFREVKHNLVPLNNYYVEKNISSASYEEYGVSMIEADFTWHSTAAECSSDANQLLLQYAWKQCPNPSELPSAHLGHDLPEAFEGFMCPEKTPNGIDLCVYVYEKEDEERTRADMALLHKIRKLGIYVLPLTTQRLESIKSHFARVLNDHQVRCLDLSNIQIGQPPLFQYKSDRLSRIQGMECRQLEVASYQILSVDQFCAIENTNILELLKRTRDREVERDETKRQDYNQLLNLAPLPEIRTGPDICPDPPGVSPVMWILMALGLLWALVWIQTRPPAPWTARFQLDPKLLLVVIQNPDGIPAWPEIEPIVWLNDQHQIPLQKTDRSGAYQLTMRMMPTLFQPQKSYTFHVNTTDPHSIFVDSRTTLYVTAAVETQPNPPQPEPTPSPLPTPKEPVEGVYQAAIDRVLFYSEHLKYLRRRIFTG
ncbi:hypothetical protein BY458DRAFT_521505 [Sporodiniella umbellata]|nr:hypothetical protein BY458DRAFT_521505 [Sporodiniella umbellata]